MKRLIIGCVIVVISIFGIVTGYATGIDLEFIMTGIKHNDLLLGSRDISMSYIVQIKQNPSANVDMFKNGSFESLSAIPLTEQEYAEYNYATKGDLARCEKKVYKDGTTKERVLHRHYIEVYDGERTKKIFYYEDGKPIMHGGISKPGVKNITIIRERTPLNFLHLAQKGGVFTPFLSDSLGGSSLKLIDGEANLNGNRCAVLEKEESGVSIITRFWVALDMGFRPLRLESKTPMAETVREAIAYKKYPGDIWVLKEGISNAYVKVPSGEKILIREEKINLMEDTFKTDDLPESYFKMDFPPEIVRIYDDLLGIYIKEPGLTENP